MVVPPRIPALDGQDANDPETNAEKHKDSTAECIYNLLNKHNNERHINWDQGKRCSSVSSSKIDLDVDVDVNPGSGKDINIIKSRSSDAMIQLPSISQLQLELDNFDLIEMDYQESQTPLQQRQNLNQQQKEIINWNWSSDWAPWTIKFNEIIDIESYASSTLSLNSSSSSSQTQTQTQSQSTPWPLSTTLSVAQDFDLNHDDDIDDSDQDLATRIALLQSSPIVRPTLDQRFRWMMCEQYNQLQQYETDNHNFDQHLLVSDIGYVEDGGDEDDAVWNVVNWWELEQTCKNKHNNKRGANWWEQQNKHNVDKHKQYQTATQSTTAPSTWDVGSNGTANTNTSSRGSGKIKNKISQSLAQNQIQNLIQNNPTYVSDFQDDFSTYTSIVTNATTSMQQQQSQYQRRKRNGELKPPLYNDPKVKPEEQQALRQKMLWLYVDSWQFDSEYNQQSNFGSSQHKQKSAVVQLHNQEEIVWQAEKDQQAGGFTLVKNKLQGDPLQSQSVPENLYNQRQSSHFSSTYNRIFGGKTVTGSDSDSYWCEWLDWIYQNNNKIPPLEVGSQTQAAIEDNEICLGLASVPSASFMYPSQFYTVPKSKQQEQEKGKDEESIQQQQQVEWYQTWQGWGEADEIDIENLLTKQQNTNVKGGSGILERDIDAGGIATGENTQLISWGAQQSWQADQMDLTNSDSDADQVLIKVKASKLIKPPRSKKSNKGRKKLNRESGISDNTNMKMNKKSNKCYFKFFIIFAALAIIALLAFLIILAICQQSKQSTQQNGNPNVNQNNPNQLQQYDLEVINKQKYVGQLKLEFITREECDTATEEEKQKAALDVLSWALSKKQIASTSLQQSKQQQGQSQSGSPVPVPVGSSQKVAPIILNAQNIQIIMPYELKCGSLEINFLRQWQHQANGQEEVCLNKSKGNGGSIEKDENAMDESADSTECGTGNQKENAIATRRADFDKLYQGFSEVIEESAKTIELMENEKDHQFKKSNAKNKSDNNTKSDNANAAPFKLQWKGREIDLQKEFGKAEGGIQLTDLGEHEHAPQNQKMNDLVKNNSESSSTSGDKDSVDDTSSNNNKGKSQKAAGLVDKLKQSILYQHSQPSVRAGGNKIKNNQRSSSKSRQWQSASSSDLPVSNLKPTVTVNASARGKGNSTKSMPSSSTSGGGGGGGGGGVATSVATGGVSGDEGESSTKPEGVAKQTKSTLTPAIPSMPSTATPQQQQQQQQASISSPNWQRSWIRYWMQKQLKSVRKHKNLAEAENSAAQPQGQGFEIEWDVAIELARSRAQHYQLQLLAQLELDEGWEQTNAKAQASDSAQASSASESPTSARSIAGSSPSILISTQVYQKKLSALTEKFMHDQEVNGLSKRSQKLKALKDASLKRAFEQDKGQLYTQWQAGKLHAEEQQQLQAQAYKAQWQEQAKTQAQDLPAPTAPLSEDVYGAGSDIDFDSGSSQAREQVQDKQLIDLKQAREQEKELQLIEQEWHKNEQLQVQAKRYAFRKLQAWRRTTRSETQTTGDNIVTNHPRASNEHNASAPASNSNSANNSASNSSTTTSDWYQNSRSSDTSNMNRSRVNRVSLSQSTWLTSQSRGQSQMWQTWQRQTCESDTSSSSSEDENTSTCKWQGQGQGQGQGQETFENEMQNRNVPLDGEQWDWFDLISNSDDAVWVPPYAFISEKKEKQDTGEHQKLLEDSESDLNLTLSPSTSGTESSESERDKSCTTNRANASSSTTASWSCTSSISIQNKSQRQNQKSELQLQSKKSNSRLNRKSRKGKHQMMLKGQSQEQDGENEKQSNSNRNSCNTVTDTITNPLGSLYTVDQYE